MRHEWFLTALLAAVVIPVAAFAHGTEVFDVTGNTPAPIQTVRFMYTTDEPMMYAQIKVFFPSDSSTEILRSVADRNGYFSFIPEGTGFWRIAAEDGMGHRSEITLNVILAGEDADGLDGKLGTTPGVGGKLPLPLAALLGVSLIINVFWIWRVAGKRLKKKIKPLEVNDAH